ncbi:hypothetical protein [Sulfuriferula nivalis]|uniref:Uncharacterized protein n=1 Tax=Sulfuriferula nivalis TaxID=2675298 RepID=A0A809S7C0_9PROT|nr:hypothetical protein [Sulfuriferula nivalis]BBO99431.1 hypothetical protein SFSGTM_01400 [Sulfuriferula nivalis]
MSKPKLPSVETQTVAFIEAVRAGSRFRNSWIKFRGFEVYLRYAQTYKSGEMELGETLVIANIMVPGRYQNRGWFMHYCELCSGLVDDAVVIECVENPHLYASLLRKEAFIETKEAEFVLPKRHQRTGSGIIIKPRPIR